MYPAFNASIWGVIIATSLFTITTVLTMLSIVLLGYWGIKISFFQSIEKYLHMLAGATICLSGCAIVFLGL
jgi:hypothetical protein